MMTSRLLIDDFIAQASRLPHHPAVVLELGPSYSYQTVHSLATAIARHVLLQPQPPASNLDTPLVGLMMHRHIGLVVSMLGVLMAGAAYVPIDPSFPPDRQRFILEHSQCQLLIIDDESYRQLLSYNLCIPPVVLVSTEGLVVSSPHSLFEMDYPEVRLHQTRSSCHSRAMGGLMYVLYTSGSTGRPKGVMVHQYGVTNVVSHFADELGVDENFRVLGLTTACFDISVLEIYMPLIRGGTLVLADSASQKDPYRLLKLIKREAIRVVQATPTTYEMMLATGWRGDVSIDFLVGGEAFRPSLLPLIEVSHSLRNVYGPTETTIWSSSFLLTNEYLVKQPHTSSSPAIPIGKPIRLTTFYLMDIEAAKIGAFQRAEGGEEGELWIGGVGVARGYLHNPELTAKSFLKNPFDDGIVYRTGDIMRQLKCGNYVFIRRMDDQVKIDGYRIELAEIEQAYSQHPLVEQAMVVVRKGKLSAYLKPKEGRDLTHHQLQAIQTFIAKSLTSYMVPKFVTVVKSFPTTANGKLDRNALPDPIFTLDVEVEVSHDKEEEDYEQTMYGHIRRLVEDQRGITMKPNSSFAAIGVDSLGAVLFIRALSDSLGGIHISPSQLFRTGVTALSFSEDLYEQLLESQPSLLNELGIVRHSARSYANKDDLLLNDDEHYEAALSSHLASNIRFLQGVRGAYTFIGIIQFILPDLDSRNSLKFYFVVLWDHYHDTTLVNPHIFLCDVSLFVILTGLTTSLQLREPLIANKDEEGNASHLPCLAKFDWLRFLKTRLIGIYPALWLSLLVYAPPWYLQNHVTDPPPPPKEDVVTLLYL